MPVLSDSGTILQYISPPAPWPPPVRSYLVEPSSCEKNGCDAIISISVHPDGHLTFTVDRIDGSRAHEKEFQAIEFEGGGPISLGASWSRSCAELSLNGLPLGPYVPGEAAKVFRVQAAMPGPSSLSHPDAAKACHDWVENRRKKFAQPSLKGGRRPKTDQEQARDLVIAVHNLETFVIDIRGSGRQHLVGHLASELRALLYWTKDDKPEGGYNPLLLRLASKAGLPLPLYSFESDMDSAPTFIRKAVFRYETGAASCVQISPKQILMDIQEWLSGHVTQLRTPGSGVGTASVKLSTKGIISETANSLGVSHYDEDIDVTLSSMRELFVFNIDLLSHILCDAAIVTGQLSKWTLSRLNERGIIDLASLSGGRLS